MNRSLCIISALMLFGVACNDNNFTSSNRVRPADKNSGEDGLQFPASTPLDLSEGKEGSFGDEGNGGQPNESYDGDSTGPYNGGSGTPTGGQGDVVKHTFELGCEESQGAIIEVGNASPSLFALQDGSTPYDDEPEKKDADKADDAKGEEPPEDEGNKGEPSTPEDDVPYEGTPTKGDPTPPTDNDARIEASVKGQFCPQSDKERLKVVFVVDYSGSMGEHTPAASSKAPPSGNDPRINNNCHRLEAAQAIMNKLSGYEGVQVAMIPFSDRVHRSKLVNFEDAANFGSYLNADYFCDYRRARGPNTSYEAAFNATKRMVDRTYGRKVVYFISDGEPTVGSPDPYTAGIQAGRNLQDTVDNLELNALLLGDTGPEAYDALVDITGTDQRVRHAVDASDLAAEITEFPDTAIDPTTGEATLTVQPYGTENLGLYSFEETDPSVWTYQTEPFVLLGEKGTTTDNIVRVTAKDQYGQTMKSTITIRYQR